MSDQPLMTSKSHIEGNNADVNIHTDRVEQGQKSRMYWTSSSEVIPAGSHFSVSLVDASALVSATALDGLARMTVSGVSGRRSFGSRLGRQLRGAIVTPVGDDVDRNAVGDNPGPSPETGLADERAATGHIYRGTTGVGVALVIGVAMTVLAIVLAAQNTDNTTVEVFAADYRAPLIVVILAAAITGVILDEIFGFIWRRHRRHRLAERAELRRLRRTQ